MGIGLSPSYPRSVKQTLIQKSAPHPAIAYTPAENASLVAKNPAASVAKGDGIFLPGGTVSRC